MIRPGPCQRPDAGLVLPDIVEPDAAPQAGHSGPERVAAPSEWLVPAIEEVEMEVRYRHRSPGVLVRWRQQPADAVRWFGVALAVAALAVASVVLPQSTAAKSTTMIGAIAYCVTTDGSPADAGLHAVLYTLGPDELLAYATGTTDANGCGVFDYVPVDTLFFVSVWSADGQQVGNGDWFESGAMTVAPTVELDTPGFFDRLALH